MCRACMTRRTQFLLAFEHRSSAVRQELLAAVSQRFAVQRLPLEFLQPPLHVCAHIELYQLTLA